MPTVLVPQDMERHRRRLSRGRRSDDALHRVLYDQTATGEYAVRRALRALEDAGLLDIELGPRGGMAKAKCTWTPLAYLAPGRLAKADDDALGELA